MPQSRGTANCIHFILPLRRPRPPIFWEASHGHGWRSASSLRKTESNPGPKPTLKLLHTLTQSPTLNKYTNSPVQPSQSSLLSPSHSLPNSPTSVQSPLPHLQNTPTSHRTSIQLHTPIYSNNIQRFYGITKRIQPARGWCVGGGGGATNCIHLPRLSGGPATQFLGKPAVRSRSMAGEAPTPCGPKQTLKTL